MGFLLVDIKKGDTKMIKTRMKEAAIKELALSNLKFAPRNVKKKSSACLNKECRLRVYGCTGNAECPGYKSP
jgi:hypothetical protein